MNETMKTHVETVRHVMFQATADKIKRDMDVLCGEIETAMALHIDNVMEKLKRDYMAVLAGACLQAEGAERILRDEVRRLLHNGDLRFTELLVRGE